jgi:hypothetical protein
MSSKEEPNNTDALKSIRNSIHETVKDQDFQQKSNVYLTLVIELYRVLVGSLLIMFVPQKCGEEVCGMTELVNSTDSVDNATLAMNIFSLCAFCGLYFVEVKRENKLITYLEVDKTLPTDNDAVGEALIQLPVAKKESILYLDGLYQKVSYVALAAFLVNSGLSGYTVFNNYLDDKTFTVYLTNVLFMAFKLKEAYDISNTKKNVFYSAYLTQPVQFNNVDPNKIQLLEENDIKLEDVVALVESPSAKETA